MKPYYRRKGKKIIIEQKIEGKTMYLKQLPEPEELLEILRRFDNVNLGNPKNKQQASQNHEEKSDENH